MVVVVKTGAETLSAAKAAEELAATTTRATRATPQAVSRERRKPAPKTKTKKATS